MAKRRCNKCGVMAVGVWIDGFPQGCALYSEEHDIDGKQMCSEMRITLLENALRRALSPDSFDGNSRIKSGELVKVLELERSALQQAAALRGPIAV